MIERETESVLDFFCRISPQYYRPNHLEKLANVFERIRRGETVDVCISVPPRHAKTELVLHAIAQLLSEFPHRTLAYATYAQDLADSKSMLARQYAVKAGVELSDEKNTLSEWRTAQGGGLLATGIGGQFTGQGCWVLVVDDPFKNREEAESPLQRDKVHHWFTSTATTRLDAYGSRIVIQARWHPDDLIGRLKTSLDETWEVIEFPAIDDQGNALFPELWPLEELRRKERAVGPYDWASLFMQRPRPRGGKVFLGEPKRYIEPRLTDSRIFLFVDGAGTENTWSDFTCASAIAIIGDESDTMEGDVLEVEQQQTTPEKSAEWLYAFQRRRGGGTFWIESTRDGKKIKELLLILNKELVIVEVTPLGDKFTRAQPFSAAWNQGRVRLPMQAPWVPMVLNQLDKFTGVGSKKDDIVDSLSGAWNAAINTSPYTSAPRGKSSRGRSR